MTDRDTFLLQRATAGDADAQCELGVRSEHGVGVPQDHREAVSWYRKAAAQGHAVAQFHLGIAYSNGDGVPQDDAQAVVWFRNAAEQGDLAAQSTLGMMYAHGQGVPKDDLLAYMWLLLGRSGMRSEPDRRAMASRDAEFLQTVAVRLSPAQRAEAERMAREWQAAFELRQE